jgi:hypothetical protein
MMTRLYNLVDIRLKMQDYIFTERTNTSEGFYIRRMIQHRRISISLHGLQSEATVTERALVSTEINKELANINGSYPV